MLMIQFMPLTLVVKFVSIARYTENTKFGPKTITNYSISMSNPLSHHQIQHKLVGNHHDDEDTSTSSTTAALIISSTSLLGLIIVIVIYGLCKYKGNKKKVAASSYENLDQSDQTSVSIPMEPTADV